MRNFLVIMVLAFCFLSSCSNNTDQQSQHEAIEKTVTDLERAERGDLFVSKKGEMALFIRKVQGGLVIRISLSSPPIDIIDFKSIPNWMIGGRVVKDGTAEHHKLLLKFALGEKAEVSDENSNTQSLENTLKTLPPNFPMMGK